jgi:hypothetical protein
LGVAQFHSGWYEDAAATIERNQELGGPSGPHMLMYLAASHALAGHVGRADAAATLLESDNSGFSPSDFALRLVSEEVPRDMLLEGLSKAGYSSEE